ncbi:SHOCT domain-containing protein [Naasia sp. SYSU D00948]|uniref:SHOCT domain-containing protein n=1 Tax=Naasia sp. SYSU D00948 TaxID=2817379 RepID=UPI001B3068ED|nr:SHOCT domain-containing protein [Naasia sp. SYSU D00948]
MTKFGKEFYPTPKPGFLGQAGDAIRKAQADREKRAKESREAASAGDLVHRNFFGGYTIEIYEGGYVRVALLMTQTTPYEKLRSVKHSFQVQDKSFGGRAAAGVMTMGLSWLASNEKRVVFLTIATDKKVHTLQDTGDWTRLGDKAAMAVEAAAQAVLSGPMEQRTVPTKSSISAPPANANVLNQIKKLGELHAAGVLTDAEFSAKKSELLKRL